VRVVNMSRLMALAGGLGFHCLLVAKDSRSELWSRKTAARADDHLGPAR
jgi:hypothetical protein